jgi:hypothetical protein
METFAFQNGIEELQVISASAVHAEFWNLWKAHKRQADDRSESGGKAFPPATHTHTSCHPQDLVMLVRRRRDLRDQQQCRMPNSKKSLMKPCSSAGSPSGVKRHPLGSQVVAVSETACLTEKVAHPNGLQDPRQLAVYPCLKGERSARMDVCTVCTSYRHRLDVCFHPTDSRVADSVELPFPQDNTLRMG